MNRLFIALVMLCMSVSLMAQKTEKTVFLYTFENLESQDQLDQVISDVLKIGWITEAKANCKWESGRGELIFVVEEIITGNEDIENIDLTAVKKIMISNNLAPIECTKRYKK